MTELLKKDTKFIWTEEREASFQELKKCLVTSPVLISPDQTKDYEVYCDASMQTLCSVLRRFSSRTWSSAYAGGKSCFICLTTA